MRKTTKKSQFFATYFFVEHIAYTAIHPMYGLHNTIADYK